MFQKSLKVYVQAPAHAGTEPLLGRFGSWMLPSLLSCFLFVLALLLVHPGLAPLAGICPPLKAGESLGGVQQGEEKDLLDLPVPLRNRPERVAWSLAPLHEFPAFNLSDPSVVEYARVVDLYLAPWRAVPGLNASAGMSKSGRGAISPRLLASMASDPDFLTCSGHIKLIRGRLFYRWGGHQKLWFHRRRFVLSVRTIDTAVRRYGLQGLSAEMFLNNCDLPKSADSAMYGIRGGYPVFSTKWWPGSLDILYPDPMDLHTNYLTHSKPMPWSEKRSRAVFRGTPTNYKLNNDMNWRASPRIRLHKMTDVRPDLLDARLVEWNQISDPYTAQSIVADGVVLGRPMKREELDLFKYEVAVDGTGGSGRPCGLLTSDRLMIKQDTVYTQFFEPLLRPYRHYVPVMHSLEDLYEKIEWAQAHDDHVQRMVAAAHEVGEVACTWEGRMLYWAVLLVKYSRQAMEAPDAVMDPPGELCSYPAPYPTDSLQPPREGRNDAERVPRGWPPACPSGQQQPPCTMFCNRGSLGNLPQVWLSADTLSHVEFETA